MKIKIDNGLEAFLKKKYPCISLAEESIMESMHVSLEDMRSSSRLQHIVFARMIFVYLCKEIYPRYHISSYLNRQHQTITYYFSIYDNMVDDGPILFQKMYEDIKSIFNRKKQEYGIF